MVCDECEDVICDIMRCVVALGQALDQARSMKVGSLRRGLFLFHVPGFRAHVQCAAEVRP